MRRKLYLGENLDPVLELSCRTVIEMLTKLPLIFSPPTMLDAQYF